MSKQEFSIPVLMAQVPTEEDAYLLLERLRWDATGVVCPHCGSLAKHYFLAPKDAEGRKTRTGSRSHRRVWKCKDCRKQFSVLTGTIFHGTKIPVRTWLMVIFEMCSSKNGVAARELERKYDLTPKSAWFMVHRIREAMKREPLAGLLTGTVVADDTWIGGKPGNMHRDRRPMFASEAPKTVVLSLVERESGEARSQVIPNVTGQTLGAVLRANVDPSAALHTDAWVGYTTPGREYASHGVVNHEHGEYVRDGVTTNHAEGFFSQLKRSVDGTHHHVSVEHLPRYLAEFDFRYSTRKINDSERMKLLIDRTGARRLTYRPMIGR